MIDGLIAVNAAAVPGWTAKTRCVAGPGVTANVSLVVFASPLVAISV
jgi:hypothetical protein